MGALLKQSSTFCERIFIVHAVVIKGKAINLGDGEGMQVPCKLKFTGQEKYVEILQKELKKLDQ